MESAPHIFDHAVLRRRRRRAAALGAEVFLLERVGGEMADRLAAATRAFGLGIDLGTPADVLRRVLGARVPTLIAVSDVPEHLAPPAIAAEIEALPIRDGSLDLVVSALALHFANDLPGVLLQVRRALRPDGLFLAALLGGDSLTELRQAFAEAEAEHEGGASPRVAPFADVRAVGGLLQRAGFALPVVDVDRLTVRYTDAFALMRDLRLMGAANPLIERRKTPLRRATLMRMGEIYAQRFADPDGRVRATFDVVWLSGWAPAASQPQPLKPGSAQRRLADALGTRELPAGEKAER